MRQQENEKWASTMIMDIDHAIVISFEIVYATFGELR